MDFGVGQSFLAGNPFDRVYKIVRTLDRDHFPFCANDLCKIDSRIPGPGADIQDATALTNSGSLPTFQNDRLPCAMLHSEAFEFFRMSAEHVIALFLPSHRLSLHRDRSRPPDSCWDSQPSAELTF